MNELTNFQGVANISYWERGNGKVSVSISNSYISSGGKNGISVSSLNRKRMASDAFKKHAIQRVYDELNPMHKKLNQMHIDRTPRPERKPIIEKLHKAVISLEDELSNYASC